MHWLAGRVWLAVRRAGRPIIASAITYLASAALGIGLASAGVPFAVAQRDAIVGAAQTSPVLAANSAGNHLQAALLDFGSNLFLGALPTSIAGLSIVGPFPIAAYRGWVGGIVSIDGQHRSRLVDPGHALYYLVTLGIQLTGFLLTMGAGVHIGLSAWKARNDSSIRAVAGVRIPPVAIRDAAYIYLLAIPIFLAGSVWEFFASAMS